MTPTEALAYLRAQVEEAQKIRAEATPGPFGMVGAVSGPDCDVGITAHGCACVLAECFEEFHAKNDRRPREAMANAVLFLHARNTDPWAALKVMAQALDGLRAGNWNVGVHPMLTPREFAASALVSAAEALKGGNDAEHEPLGKNHGTGRG